MTYVNIKKKITCREDFKHVMLQIAFHYISLLAAKQRQLIHTVLLYSVIVKYHFAIILFYKFICKISWEREREKVSQNLVKASYSDSSGLIGFVTNFTKRH